VVNRTLKIINLSGFLISLLLFISALVNRHLIKTRALIVEMISLGTIAVMTGTGHWIIAARLNELRNRMGKTIDELPLTDPARISFNNLHEYSVIALSLAMIAGIIALLVCARRVQKN
jgi:hypothetical protein